LSFLSLSSRNPRTKNPGGHPLALESYYVYDGSTRHGACWLLHPAIGGEVVLQSNGMGDSDDVTSRHWSAFKSHNSSFQSTAVSESSSNWRYRESTAPPPASPHGVLQLSRRQPCCIHHLIRLPPCYLLPAATSEASLVGQRAAQHSVRRALSGRRDRKGRRIHPGLCATGDSGGSWRVARAPLPFAAPERVAAVAPLPRQAVLPRRRGPTLAPPPRQLRVRRGAAVAALRRCQPEHWRARQ